jgi:hypothetical protein
MMERKRKMKIHEDKYQKARFLVRAYKKVHWEGLRADRNIIGAAFGRRTAQDELTDDPSMVIYVMRKVSKRFLPPSRLLPRRFYVGGDCVEVDVVETGPLYPAAYNARLRPAPAGVSISHTNVTAGTLGSVVTDNTDRSTCILSNNHVIADHNAAAIGDPIVQPGTFDGGADPGDTIATLKRFVTINATGNTVDAAIAEITGAGMVVDQVINNIIPVATAAHPAVGLFFGWSCNRSFMNPITDVLNQLNISFPAGAGVTTAPDIGMDVETVGRTSEYTTSTIKEIDATITLPYNFGDATFDGQFSTGFFCEGGDSGSLVYEGGEGSDIDNCGCGSTNAAAGLLQASLRQERCMANEIRDKYLRQTLIGRWAVDLFFRNEERLLDRYHKSKIDAEDKEYARKLYSKHSETARKAFVEGERSEERLTSQYLKEARTALKRAEKYMSKDESEVAERLFKIVKEHAEGKNARELLALLNSEKLFEEVKAITSKVKFLRMDSESCQ